MLQGISRTLLKRAHNCSAWTLSDPSRTLFDENASCHFALGKAYPTCVEGGTDLEDDQVHQAGLNDSLIHEDFMVGTADLNITGYKNDQAFQIFKEGNWAF